MMFFARPLQLLAVAAGTGSMLLAVLSSTAQADRPTYRNISHIHSASHGQYCPCPCPTDAAPVDGTDIPAPPTEGEDLPEVAELTSDSGFASASQSALPNVMGDSSGFGSCGMVTVAGVPAVIGHPNFGCSRINLAENGSPFIRDRVFVNYNHFEEPTETDLFSVPGEDNSARLNVDRITLGFEKSMCCECMSFEIRMPFNYQLDPLIYIEDTRGGAGNLINVPLEETAFELGNIGGAIKFLIADWPELTVTGGSAVTLPTARGVQINARIDNDFDIGGITESVDMDIAAAIPNDVIFLTPFVAAAYYPECSPYFAQGFLQVDVPLNKQRGTLGVVDNTGGGFDIAGSESLRYQTLLRVNSQFGYQVYENHCCCSGWLDSLVALLELHYTTTLTDAQQSEFLLGTLNGEDVSLSLGNPVNRVDVLNLTVGGAADIGCNKIHAGLVIPLRHGTDKPFDWEFLFAYNRNF